MFQRFNCLISSSDNIVASLYQQRSIQAKIADLLPRDFGEITQSKVAQYIAQYPDFLQDLEKILHPVVEKRHLWDIQQAKIEKKSLIVLEIPLLFEINWQVQCDLILLTTCRSEIQYNRVMARLGMTEEKFFALQSRQWPEARKKKLADFVLATNDSRLHTFQQLKYLLKLHCLNNQKD